MSENPNRLRRKPFRTRQNPNSLSRNLYRTTRNPNSLRRDPYRLHQKLNGLRHNPYRFRCNLYRFRQNPNRFPPVPFGSPRIPAGFAELPPTSPPRQSSHRLNPTEFPAIVTRRNDPIWAGSIAISVLPKPSPLWHITQFLCAGAQIKKTVRRTQNANTHALVPEKAFR